MQTFKWVLFIGFFMGLFYAWGWAFNHMINDITDEFARKVAYEEQLVKCKKIYRECMESTTNACVDDYSKCVETLKRFNDE